MKNKYNRLDKKGKKEALIDFKNSNTVNANIYKKVKRLKIICVIGMIYAIISFVVDFYLTVNALDFVIDGVLLVFCLIFYIASNSILSNQVNKYLIEKSKQSIKRK